VEMGQKADGKMVYLNPNIPVIALNGNLKLPVERPGLSAGINE